MTDFGLGDCNEADVLDALRWHGLTERPEPCLTRTPFKPLAMSWSGSERQRKEQGTCAPYRPGTFTPRFRIPTGTLVKVCRVEDSQQRFSEHTTKQDLSFERYELREGADYKFRESGYFILVKTARVIHRERK